MYETLREVMSRADTGVNIGYAVLFEVVKTITTIYPDQSLLELAAASTSRCARTMQYYDYISDTRAGSSPLTTKIYAMLEWMHCPV